MIKASEFCVNVFDGTHDTPKPTESGYKLLTSKNILSGRLDKDNAYYISEEDYHIINQRSQVKQWDILFSMIGTVGNVCLITDSDIDFAIKNMGVFSCGDEYKAKWLYFYLQSPYAQKIISNYLNGAVQKFLSLQMLRDFPVPAFTPLSKNIVDVIWNLDEKIKVNQVLSTELEALAKTIYDYWFLQFEFPNEEGLPYKSSGGKMVWSEELKREIPEGWGCTKIRDVLAKIPKTTHINTTDYLEFGSIPIIDQSENIIAGYTNDKSSQITLNIGCTVFGDHTRVVKYICFPFARGADGTQILKSNTLRIPDILLYQIVKHIDLSNYGYARHFKFLKDTNVILPNESISNKYVNIVSSMYEMQAKFIFENHELAALRDWLLPMLMNGQVGFKEQER